MIHWTIGKDSRKIVSVLSLNARAGWYTNLREAANNNGVTNGYIAVLNANSNRVADKAPVIIFRRLVRRELPT